MQYSLICDNLLDFACSYRCICVLPLHDIVFDYMKSHCSVCLFKIALQNWEDFESLAVSKDYKMCNHAS